MAPRFVVPCAMFASSFLMATLHAAPTFFAGTGHLYEAIFVSEGITWDNAHVVAGSMGGHLATITSQPENAFLFGLINSPAFFTPPSVANDYLGPWFGGRRSASSAWSWVTGEPFEYTNWEFNQPDGAFGSEQRTQFYKVNAGTVGDRWSDHPGDPIAGYDLPRGFIVEYPTAFTADSDVDGDVDGTDFLIWQRGFGLLPALKPDGDIDGDKDVDDADLAIWAQQFGSAMEFAVVPEPTSLAVCALLAVPRVGRRRQRRRS